MQRFAAAVLLTVLAGCSGPASDIRVAAVGRADVVEIVNAPARVAARAQSTLTAVAGGHVAEVYVRDGQRVPAGTRLLRIESPEARARLAEAKHADAAARPPPAPDPAARFTEIRAAANRLPAAQRAEALAALAEAETAYQAALRGAGSLAAAQRVPTRAAVAVAQRVVDALVVTAPISGTVQLGGVAAEAEVPALGDLGNLTELLGGSGSGPVTSVTEITVGVPVTTGTVLATVFDLSALTLVAEVDETDVFLVRRGVRAAVELDAVPGARYRGIVTAVDLSPTASVRGGVTYRVRLALGPGTLAEGGPAPPPRPGMSAVADLRVRTARDAVAVPAAAIVRQGARDAVWVIDSRGRARTRVVTLGAQGDDVVQVTRGLEPGERIVVRGADVVTEGQRLG